MNPLILFQKRSSSNSGNLPGMQWWRCPQQRILTKVVALLVTLTFVFPYLTWAFEAQAYPRIESFWHDFKIKEREKSIKKELNVMKFKP